VDSFDKKPRREFTSISDTHVAEDEDTVWLLSYSDLMTLLFTFFVMLYSSNKMDDGENLRKALASYVQGSGDANKAGVNIEQIKSTLKERIEQEKLLKEIDVSVKNNGLNITFSSNLLFELGASELRPDSLKTVEQIIKIVQEKGGPQFRVRVEGHTDDNPIISGNYKSNWELSGARAANIVALFEKNGFPAKSLLAVGYGSSRPLVPNRTPAGEKDVDGQRKNRRVVLTVYKPTSDKSD